MKYYLIETNYGDMYLTHDELYSDLLDAGHDVDYHNEEEVLEAHKEVYDGEHSEIEKDEYELGVIQMEKELQSHQENSLENNDNFGDM